MFNWGNIVVIDPYVYILYRITLKIQVYQQPDICFVFILFSMNQCEFCNFSVRK